MLQLYPSPGFQGASSLTSILDKLGHRGLLPHPSAKHISLGEEEASRMDALSMNRLAMVEDGVGILDMLLAVMVDEFLDRVFAAWKGCGLESHLGSFLVGAFVETMTHEICQLPSGDSWRVNLSKLSQRIFDRSSQPVDLGASATLQDFAGQFTGEHLRWETIGVILTLIGYVSHHGVSHMEKMYQSRATSADRDAKELLQPRPAPPVPFATANMSARRSA